MTGEQWSQVLSLLIGGLVTIAVEALRRLQKQRNQTPATEALTVAPTPAPAVPPPTTPPGDVTPGTPA